MQSTPTCQNGNDGTDSTANEWPTRIGFDTCYCCGGTMRYRDSITVRLSPHRITVCVACRDRLEFWYERHPFQPVEDYLNATYEQQIEMYTR